MPTLAIRLSPADNVVVARADILPGTAIPGEGVTSAAHVPAGHKVATAAIAKGGAVRKYNQIIGFATSIVERATSGSMITASAQDPASPL